MTISTTPARQTALPRVECPPLCKYADAPESHDIEGDQLGDAYLIHEVDFGVAFGSLYQYLDGSASTARVTADGVTMAAAVFAGVADLRRVAQDLLAAADWLVLVSPDLDVSRGHGAPATS
jgi:hypothetical protein